VTTKQWRAFWAAFLGWVLDGFDATILTFILIDIQNSFSVDRALAGALGTVTLLTRLIGGVTVGTLADRFGRKTPLMLSVLWFSLFACLGGFSTSFGMLLVLRALFGLGMGGEWAAGVPLVLEHWPARLRGTVAGVLQGGFSWGFILAAAAFELIYPLFPNGSDLAWRTLLWIGILPALLVFWIRVHVSESPLWLEERARRSSSAGSPARDRLSFWRLFGKELRPQTIHACALMSAFMFFYYSTVFWYPTFLRDSQRSTLPYAFALNIGGIIGAAVWGALSETRLGQRRAIALGTVLGLAVLPIYLYAPDANTLWVGALLLGGTGCGVLGIAPSYLTERFPTDARGAGAGFAYHVGVAVASISPVLLGSLQVSGWPIRDVMTIAIGASALAIATLVWLAPETRGQAFASYSNQE
jgi:SHS family lactate transporter-like MFS transporter